MDKRFPLFTNRTAIYVQLAPDKFAMVTAVSSNLQFVTMIPDKVTQLNEPLDSGWIPKPTREIINAVIQTALQYQA
jgi:hypothetical protein